MKFATQNLLSDHGAYQGDTKRNYEDLLDQIEYAEALGYDQAWVAEHHSSSYGSIPSPQVFLSAAADRTETIELGPLISILPFADPVRLAEDWAMVDLISDGRLQFGVGRGYQPSEFRNMRVDQEQSRDIFLEHLDVIHGLWTHEEFEYHGEHVDIPRMSITPRPLQDPPPMYLASISSSTIDLAAELGMNVAATTVTNPLAELKPRLAEAREKLIEHGVPEEEIDIPVQICATFTDDDLATTKERIRPYYEWYEHKLLSLAPGGANEEIPASYEEYEQEGSEEISLEGFIERDALILDPDYLIEELEDCRETFGLRTIIFAFGLGGQPDAMVRRSMEIVAEEVMPHFK